MASKVAVAISGGVDSAVTAAMLVEQGFDVSAVTLRLLPGTSSACEHAELIARHLGISHTILDLSAEFEDAVIKPFCRSYAAGLTPNPCVICNRKIKFGCLLDYIRQAGMDYLATGHYARLVLSDGQIRLLKGVDSAKDQSYFLYALSQPQLSSLMFPLGVYHKRDVYIKARGLGLDNLVQTHESQDICFIPGGNYTELVEKCGISSPGDIVDSNGRVLGRHAGIARYTVGQRQGLGISSQQRLYVLEIDAAQNCVIVGSHAELYSSEISVDNLTWPGGGPPVNLRDISVKVRSQAGQVPAEIILAGDTANIRLASPQWAVSPGQSAVFYRGDEVLVGGIITGAGPGNDDE